MAPRRRLVLFSLVPFGFGVTRLALLGSEAVQDLWPWLAIAAIALGLPVVLTALALPWRAARLAALVAPCILAPLAVWLPWAVEPTRLGPGLVGLEFFVSWLGRYPTVGPANHEVLMGIGCVLGASAMPVLVGILALREARPRVIAVLTALALVPWLPAAWELDLPTLAFGGWLGGPLGALAVAGPLLRFAAILSMLGLTVRAFVRARRRPPLALERLRARDAAPR